MKNENNVRQQLDIICINKNSNKVEFAFEANGIYWHQTSVKSHNYHLNKTIQCEQRGIKLMHIWEDEWHTNRDNIKKMIFDLINDTICIDNKYDKITLPRAKFCKLVNISGYHLISESTCNIIQREINGDVFEVEDCGTLTYEKTNEFI